MLGIRNVVFNYHPVHRFPMDKRLEAGADFKLNSDETVTGYGPDPVDVLVVGVSCFGPQPIPPEGHPVVHSSQFFEPCSVLSRVPSGVKLVQDYEVPYRYRLKCLNRMYKGSMAHFTIYPVNDISVAQWQEIIYITQLTNPELSCEWLPCEVKARGEIVNTDFCDGSEDRDTDGLQDFGIHALYQLSKFIFPCMNLHDKIHLNGMLTMIAAHKEQTFDHFVSDNMPFMRAIYCILSNTSNKVRMPSTLCNFAGIVLSKLEVFFGT